MSVRITGGAFAGRLLLGPPGGGVRRGSAEASAGLRPTAARLRKSVFEVLGDEIPGARVLDLCAGVGTLGFEAISRGARHCVFVERAHRMSRLIERNAQRLGTDAFRLLGGAAARELGRLERSGTEFGIVFLDPPWEAWEAGTAGSLLADASRVVGGVLAAEHRSSHSLPASLGAEPGDGASGTGAGARFVRSRTIVAGDGAFSLYRRPAERSSVPTSFS